MTDQPQPDAEALKAFKLAYPHLDHSIIGYAWGKPVFKHSHVAAMAEGWCKAWNVRAPGQSGDGEKGLPIPDRFDPDGFDHHAACPICHGIEGCSHSVAERKAALERAAPAVDDGRTAIEKAFQDYCFGTQSGRKWSAAYPDFKAGYIAALASRDSKQDKEP